MSRFIAKRSRALYGWDSREEVCNLRQRDPIVDLKLLAQEIPGFINNAIKAANSVCSIVFHKHVTHLSSGHARLEAQQLASSYSLHKGEAFHDQPVVGMGTGFLVAPDVVATAGHVVKDHNVRDLRFVFGYELDKITIDDVMVCETDVIPGESLLEAEYIKQGVDWALVKLANAQHHRTFLANVSGPPAKGRVYTLGHPSGLPLKFAGPGRVRRVFNNGCFSTSLDALGGNSGSPVLDSTTHELVGIIARGDRDYEPEPVTGTLTAVVLPENGGCGQTCTSTIAFKHHLSRLGAKQ